MLIRLPSAAKLDALERIVLALWVGGLWAVGFLVAPSLFKVLDDRALAGKAAGALFYATSTVGIVCGAILLSLALYRRGGRTWRVWAVATMLLVTLVGRWGLYPALEVLRSSAETASARFAWMHLAAAALFVLNAALGLALLAAGGQVSMPARDRPER